MTIDTLKQLDTDIFLFLNGLHAGWLDQPMFYMTKEIFWLPLYLYLIFISFKKKKSNAWWTLLGVAIAILISDQIMTSFMKPFFARLRPSHEPALEGMVHLVNHYRGGLYGFASGHAATTFGVATFLWLSLRSQVRWIGLIFVWASIMTYTRIYLGVHYPGDIIVGAMVGSFCGWVIWRIVQRLTHVKQPDL